MPAIDSPIILEKCLALINTANIDAEADGRENCMHKDNAADIPKDPKKEKAKSSNIPTMFIEFNSAKNDTNRAKTDIAI